MFDILFGAEVSPALKVILAFVLVLILIGVTAWLVRRFGAERFGGAATRGRQPRLAVVDKAAIDSRRSLIIVRRDNVEHLLMIGGATDVLVEPNIVRATSAARDKAAEIPPGRAPAPDTLPRPLPLGDGMMWPLQPQAEQPRPPNSDMSPAPEQAPVRPEPKREPSLSVPRKTPAPAARPAVTPAEPPTPAGSDQNLAEMAQRLEAALRRPNETRPAPEIPAKAEPVAPRAPALEPKPARTENKPAAPKSSYDSLEQEMANLLGRPPGKP